MQKSGRKPPTGIDRWIEAQALAGLCDQLTAAGARYPGTGLVLRYEAKSCSSPV